MNHRLELTMLRSLLPLFLCTTGTVWAATVNEDGDDSQIDAGKGDGKDLSVAVPGFAAPAPGEHPRLFFRKSDLPRLKARMSTPTGQAIIARLKATLGGGEAMPTIYSTATQAYDPIADQNLPEGAFTVSHAAGFGFLWQLTGEKKYVDLAKECMQKSFSGQRDRDDRYSWVGAGGQLRVGPVLAWHALAYDLCYDGWDEAFRKEVAQRLLGTWVDPTPEAAPDPKKSKSKRDKTQATRHSSIPPMIEKTRHGPASNHYGAQIGGAAIALLALRGDPDGDPARVEQLMPTMLAKFNRTLTEGFGDGGIHAEGCGPSQMAANPSFVPAIQALRIAGGRDFAASPNGLWMSLRWLHSITGTKGNPVYPIRMSGMGEAYGTRQLIDGRFKGGGMSHGGAFIQGIGAVPEQYRGAMAWSVQTYLKDGSFDAVNYPHRAVLAYVNWPEADAIKPPTSLPPRTDNLHNFWEVRSGWAGADDIVVNGLLGGGPEPYCGPFTDNDILAQGCGTWLRLPGPRGGTVQRIDLGGGAWSAGNGQRMTCIDFSGAAGVPGVIAVQGEINMRFANKYDSTDPEVLIQRGRSMVIATFAKDGKHPKAVFTGNKATLGGLTLTLDERTWKVERGTPGIGTEIIDAREAKKSRMLPELDPKDIVLPKEPLVRFTLDAATRSDQGFASADAKHTAEITGKAAELRAAPGIFGEAVVGTGLDALIKIPKHADLALNGDFGFSLWFKPDGRSRGEMLLFERSYWGKEKTEVVNLTTFGGLEVAHGFLVIANGPRGGVNLLEPRWHHVCTAWDYKTRTATIYVDGEQRGVRVVGKDVAPGAYDLHLLGRGPGPTPKGGWAGAIDDFRMYDVALTRGNARALWDEGKAKATAE